MRTIKSVGRGVWFKISDETITHCDKAKRIGTSIKDFSLLAKS
jgi:hypothetical protein